jgi:multimeric flavodoxin WrbA
MQMNGNPRAEGGEMTSEVLRIVGLSMSPRPSANTERMLEEALNAAASYGASLGIGAQTEILSLAGKKILPCQHCNACLKTGSGCVLHDDWNEVVRCAIDPVPDGFIVGSPVYYFHITSLGRAFMERFTSLMKGKWHSAFPCDPPDFSRSAAGAVAVGTGRNSGIEHTLSDILDWLLMLDFVVVGGTNIGAGGYTRGDDSPAAIEQDALGLQTAARVGEKVAKTAAMMKTGIRALGIDLPPVGWERRKRPASGSKPRDGFTN